MDEEQGIEETLPSENIEEVKVEGNENENVKGGDEEEKGSALNIEELTKTITQQITEQLKKEQAEQERLGKLSEEERTNEALKKATDEKQALENELNKMKLEKYATDELVKQDLSPKVINLVVGSDEKATMDNIKVLKEYVDNEVQKHVEQRYKASGTAVKAGNGNNKNDSGTLEDALRKEMGL